MADNPLIRMHYRPTPAKSQTKKDEEAFFQEPSPETGRRLNRDLWTKLGADKDFIRFTPRGGRGPYSRQQPTVRSYGKGAGGMGGLEQLVGIAREQLASLRAIASLIAVKHEAVRPITEQAAQIRSQAKRREREEGATTTSVGSRITSGLMRYASRNPVGAVSSSAINSIVKKVHAARKTMPSSEGGGDGILASAFGGMEFGGIAGLGVVLAGALAYEAAKGAYSLSKPWTGALMNMSQVSRLTGTGMGGIVGRFATGRGGVGSAPSWMLNMGYTTPEAISLMSTLGTPRGMSGPFAQMIMQQAGRSKYLGGLGLGTLGGGIASAANVGAMTETRGGLLRYMKALSSAMREAADQGVNVATAFKGITGIVSTAGLMGLGVGAPASTRWAERMMATGLPSMRTGAGQQHVLSAISSTALRQSGVTQTLEMAGTVSLLGHMPRTEKDVNKFLSILGVSDRFNTPVGRKYKKDIIQAARHGDYSSFNYLLASAIPATPGYRKWIGAGLTGSMGKMPHYRKLIGTAKALGGISPLEAEALGIAPHMAIKPSALGTYGPSMKAGAGEAYKLYATVKSAQFKLTQATFNFTAGAIIKGAGLLTGGVGGAQSVGAQMSNAFVNRNILKKISPTAQQDAFQTGLMQMLKDIFTGTIQGSGSPQQSRTGYSASPITFPFSATPNHPAYMSQGYSDPVLSASNYKSRF